MLLFKKFWVVLVLFFLIWSCKKSTSANWDVDVALPIVNSTLNIQNFAGDSLFSADNTGLLSLSIHRQVASLKLDSLLNLPDTAMPAQSFSPLFTTTLQPGAPINFFNPTEVKFDISNGIELKRADVRTGILNLKFSNTATTTLNFSYSIPSAVKNGTPFTISENIPPGNETLIKDYDLAGYSLNLRGLNGNVFNTIVQKYIFGLPADATEPAVIQGTQGIVVNISYSKIIPQYVEGYFGNQSINIAADTLQLGLTKNFSAGNFMLSQATMNFNIINEFGAEFSGYLSSIQSINTRQNSKVILHSNQLSNININAASKSGATIYPTTWPISLTGANSNITAFISNIPDELAYRGQVTLNPLGNTSGYNNFAFYNTGIRIVADINIPLRFTADYFRLQSFTNVDFSNTKQLDNVNSGKFVISATNGYPFDAMLQAYLLDESSQVIDSLFIPNANTIAKGQVDNLNDVTSPTRSQIKVPFSKIKVDHLRRTKSIKIVAYFIMPSNPPEIRLYESYQFGAAIVAELNYNVNL